MQRSAMTGRLPILTFHAVDEVAPSPIAFPAPRFARAIETLARLGARTPGIEEAVRQLRNRGGLPDRAIVLTFDDGYRSVYDAALPSLLRRGFTATVFLTVGRGRTGADDRLPSMNGRPMLSWGEIRAMHREGMTFGAHSLTHPDLTTLPPSHRREEVEESKARIEDALGAPVTCFAYPYGAMDRQCRQIVAEHFTCSCSDRLGLVNARSDPYALERVDAYYLGTIRLFEMIFTGMFPWYLRARNIPRLARRRLRAAVQQPLAGGARSQEEAVHGR